MARRARVHFPGALYHVISRGNQRQRLYKDDEDYRRFKALLGEAVKGHSLTLWGPLFDGADPLSALKSGAS